MSNLSRKQREIAERHNRFLTIGRSLLHEAGFQHFSMDRVAELAEYSKGTIYQHFNCKEELLGQLCVQCLQRLHALTQRACNHQGSHRERVFAFVVAHSLHQNHCIEDTQMMQHFLNDHVLDKLSPATRERYRSLQRDIFNSLKRLVDDAKEAGDLPGSSADSAHIAVGLWSLIHGPEYLSRLGLTLEDVGINNSFHAVVPMMDRLLDGLNWAPLVADSAERSQNTSERVEQLKHTLFKTELPNLQPVTR